MEQALVSIIVVSYNHSLYIKECLDSIKSQTHTNIELIVADDASKDNSVEIFENWLSENNYFAKKNFHKENTGLATTLNECMEMVTGKYIKLIAADDYLHPQSIEKCLAKFNENDKLGFVFSDTYFVDKHSNLLDRNLFSRELYSLPYEQLKDELMNKCFICGPTILISCKAWTEAGKYNPTKIVEDYDRWLRIITMGYEFGVVIEKLAYYRSHGENISSKSNGKLQEEVFMLNFKYSTRKLFLNTEIENIYLRTSHRYSREFFDVYKKYKYCDDFSYFFIKNDMQFALKVYRIVKQKLSIKN
ncbi:glycosyltransferase [Bergeyella sp. RCAD1439]|uniref:glycosyltransferase n=1 Tax=Bergeyella anatis TaxID=3113737 RepID=UPI002E1950F9|nr:glycosyltransferase [Bergeyella sp. RCAD1439]